LLMLLQLLLLEMTLVLLTVVRVDAELGFLSCQRHSI